MVVFHQKVFSFSKGTWAVTKSLDKTPGLSDRDKSILMDVYGAEGGAAKDPNSSAMGGILDATLRQAQAKGVDGLADVKKAADMTPEQMAKVYKFHLDDSLYTVGGGAALKNLDQASGAAVADTVFRHGRAGGTELERFPNELIRR